jgi:hypothetical protein
MKTLLPIVAATLISISAFAATGYDLNNDAEPVGRDRFSGPVPTLILAAVVGVYLFYSLKNYNPPDK